MRIEYRMPRIHRTGFLKFKAVFFKLVLINSRISSQSDGNIKLYFPCHCIFKNNLMNAVLFLNSHIYVNCPLSTFRKTHPCSVEDSTHCHFGATWCIVVETYAPVLVHKLHVIKIYITFGTPCQISTQRKLYQQTKLVFCKFVSVSSIAQSNK